MNFMKIILIFVIVGFTSTIVSQNVEKFTIDEKIYYGSKAIPKEIEGIYYYEKVKEPIVEIRADGTGYLGAEYGKYTRIDVAMAFDLGYAICLGERFRKL